MLYKAEYTDFTVEWIFSATDEDAIEEAETYGELFNLFEIDEELNEIRAIY